MRLTNLHVTLKSLRYMPINQVRAVIRRMTADIRRQQVKAGLGCGCGIGRKPQRAQGKLERKGLPLQSKIGSLMISQHFHVKESGLILCRRSSSLKTVMHHLSLVALDGLTPL